MDRERERVRFTEFKSAFKQTFTTTPSSGTFFGTNFDGKYKHDSKERRNSRSRSTDRNRSRNSQRDKSPYRHRWNGSASPSCRNKSEFRSGSKFHNFHAKGPGKTNFLLDTGAQRSCLGADIFLKMGGDMKSLKKSKNSFVFGDGPPTPSIGIAKISIRGYVFEIDIVLRDIPRLIGMDILSSK